MDIKKIEQILQLFEKSSVATMELEVDEIKIKLEKTPSLSYTQPTVNVMSPVATMNTPVVEEVKEEVKGTWVKAPLVGTYYASSSPENAPYITVGCKVNKGDTLCLIEAMKVMNELKAPRDGVILDIVASNSMMVSYDQPLILIGEAS
ncbi:MAG TPA: acetyl-CoA carboxylase, biotin carboxyl carrier protein [Erysipelotrichaceae bacterium]|nr:acetyl-CoA carboxylase, biotin carboxyl carrier protein [Erysipelotrichaceae bacterium]